MFLYFIFWGCAATLLYVYVLYPLLIACCARLFGRLETPAPQADADLPNVTMVIAAYNEESVIGTRVANALSMDYPSDKLEIVVASDGSEDRTSEIVRNFSDERVSLLDFSKRSGKSSVVNVAIAVSRGKIIIMSDANTMMAKDAIRQLVRWFPDNRIGTVCGRMDLKDSTSGRNVDGIYWRYENLIKRSEGRLNAMLGGNGAIYAIRRTAFRPIPADTLIDDLTIPLLSRLQTGLKTVYDRDAVAHGETAPALGAEFHRRARIATGGAQAIPRLYRLLAPRFGWTALSFLSHKVLRWLSPLFLIGMVVSSVCLAREPVYAALLLTQLLFYLVAAINTRISVGGGLGRMLRVPTLSVTVNAALLVGLLRWLRGGQSGVWIRTPRTS